MLPAWHQIEMVDPKGGLLSEGGQGTHPGHEYALPDDAELLAAYGQIVVGRRVNDLNSALVRQGRMAVYPTSHGQEACLMAAALCPFEGDWMLATYGDAAAVMTHGVDPVHGSSTLESGIRRGSRPFAARQPGTSRRTAGAVPHRGSQKTWRRVARLK